MLCLYVNYKWHVYINNEYCLNKLSLCWSPGWRHGCVGAFSATDSNYRGRNNKFIGYSAQAHRNVELTEAELFQCFVIEAHGSTSDASKAQKDMRNALIHDPGQWASGTYKTLSISTTDGIIPSGDDYALLFFQHYLEVCRERLYCRNPQNN